ncbi:hypothetical protein [Sphingobium sp. KCTC 72723]|uniref:hypothetical protein n=1 Tax=Sphingobium sp. KCTC 72723 TaxID=2733867 RepID=UPI00165D578C|nr:hypothetical protein [Sphingobium sp. KCTC 72723]
MATLAPWHLRDDDRVYGLDRLAAWLAFPFLHTRMMVREGYLPHRREGRSIYISKAEAIAHFDATEAAKCRPDAIAARLAGEPDVIAGTADIAAHLGMSLPQLRHHYLRNGVPLFQIGRTPYARRPSLNLWATALGSMSGWDRRRARKEGADHGQRL